MRYCTTQSEGGRRGVVYGTILVLQAGLLRRWSAGPSVAGPAGVIVGTLVVSDNSLSVSLQTSTGRNYALEYKATLQTANWSTVAWVADDGSTQTLARGPLTSASGIFRVRVD